MLSYYWFHSYSSYYLIAYFNSDKQDHFVKLIKKSGLVYAI